MPICWICGAVADSAEHMVKASDVRAIFPRLTQMSPAFRHSYGRTNEAVRGANAVILKFRPSLCQYCNNSRSQPWDRAWQLLERNLREAKPPLKTGDRIPLGRIFISNRTESMLHVHQFFTKLMGCVAIEHNIPLPVASFAQHLKAGAAEPTLRIAFVHIPPGSTKIKIHIGNVNTKTDKVTGVIATAVWHYVVGSICVEVSYVRPGFAQLRFVRKLGWHPDDVSRTWKLD
jgi:hypothetical protein